MMRSCDDRMLRGSLIVDEKMKGRETERMRTKKIRRRGVEGMSRQHQTFNLNQWAE